MWWKNGPLLHKLLASYFLSIIGAFNVSYFSFVPRPPLDLEIDLVRHHYGHLNSPNAAQRRQSEMQARDKYEKWNKMHLLSFKVLATDDLKGNRSAKLITLLNFNIKGLYMEALIDSNLILVHSVYSQSLVQRCGLSWAVVERTHWETEFPCRNNIKLRPVHQILSQFEWLRFPSGANLGPASFRERYCTALFIYSNYIGAP